MPPDMRSDLPKGSEVMVEELVAPRSWYIEAIPVDGVVYVIEPKTPGRRNE